ncbi:glycosyltransferase family 2 protein [Streptomyces griseocarneus]|uniref:glycosyltransferase family 2 protein n=1 Tax=Streptomyces griseocarneus TaxID=51201 RepID=UPI00167DAC27|nr:glycosyltransferase family 2 protein [Streptomyces griseocarneus]MBZ6474235.1 glycosyltransferase [Streptomyces griseocarneus]GHG52775.1 N-acetyl-glucosamine transferase [Streptomyces griseocarneus]
MAALDAIIQEIAVVIAVFTALYNISLLSAGIVLARRFDGSLRAQLRPAHEPPVALRAGWGVFVLVPCLNEERVIANTLRCLLDGQPGVRVVVVDDGSDDATARIVRAVGAGRVTLVRRKPPAARQGKGAALNAGLCAVRRLAGEEGRDPGRTLVCVLDADGRMTPGAASRVTRLFEDPAVGGAQLAVRVRGRHRWALRLQDLEFWTLSALTQYGRIATGTVSMGGNGQFSRLSALDGVGPRPWSDSLTEDLDLGISLAARGWTVTSTTAAFVSQQGLTGPRRLLRQRTRWYHGHMSALRRLPELWARPAVGVLGRVELTGYLLVPYVVTLPTSLVQQYLPLRLLLGDGAGTLRLVSGPAWLNVLVWQAPALAAYLVSALLHWRRTDDLPLWKAVCFAPAVMLCMYLGFLACWCALWRIATRRGRWAKTERAVEAPLTSPPATPTVAPGHPARRGPARTPRPKRPGTVRACSRAPRS